MINKLNKRIDVCKMTTTVDSVLGTNEPTTEFVLKNIWADIQPRTGSLLSGREAGTMLSKTTHLIKIRSEMSSNITDDCYIKWTDEFDKEHIFNIDYALPPAGSKYANLYCSEVIRNVV